MENEICDKKMISVDKNVITVGELQSVDPIDIGLSAFRSQKIVELAEQVQWRDGEQKDGVSGKIFK